MKDEKDWPKKISWVRVAWMTSGITLVVCIVFGGPMQFVYVPIEGTIRAYERVVEDESEYTKDRLDRVFTWWSFEGYFGHFAGGNTSTVRRNCGRIYSIVDDAADSEGGRKLLEAELAGHSIFSRAGEFNQYTKELLIEHERCTS